MSWWGAKSSVATDVGLSGNPHSQALMDQGFFAEDLFDGDASSGEVIETITVPANGAEFANVGNSGVRNVTRWWRFKVQSAAEGPDGVYGTDGTYAPTDTTDLECVRYKFQMDATATFDSQVHANPLRERLTNYDGNFLTVAAMQPTTSMGISNPTLAATQNGTPDQGQTSANDPGIGNNSFGVVTLRTPAASPTWEARSNSLPGICRAITTMTCFRRQLPPGMVTTCGESPLTTR